MVPKAPPAPASLEGPPPSADRAWRSLGGSPPATIEVLRESSRSKPALYRLIFDEPGRPAVYAKRSATSDLALERTVYQDILPHLPLTVPRCFGSCRESDGATWLFVEDVGDRRPSSEAPEERRVAARWLGLLHRSAADDPRAARLPDAGPGRYLASLRAGREGVRRNLGNRALTDADREILNGLLEQLDAVESRWPAIEQACQGLPVTLVHGDFRPKNVRIRDAHAGAALYVLDWEMAGWGIPAADLASAIGPAMTVAIDPETYLNAMRERWPDLDGRALQRLAILGRIFQALASADWGSSSLIFESVRHLLRPVGAMRHYRAHLVEGLRAGAEHLGWS